MLSINAKSMKKIAKKANKEIEEKKIEEYLIKIQGHILYVAENGGYEITFLEDENLWPKSFNTNILYSVIDELKDSGFKVSPFSGGGNS